MLQCVHVCGHIVAEVMKWNQLGYESSRSAPARSCGGCVKRARVDITYRGKVVARLVPVSDREARAEESRAAWARWERLAKEVSAVWPKGVSAVEAIREQRREL